MSIGAKVAGFSGAAVIAAAALVGQFEGHRNSVYLDPLGIPTVCEGHTGKDHLGNPLKLGMTFTNAQCAAFKEQDMREAYRIISKCYPDMDKRTTGEKAAWTSFTLNVGPGGTGVKDGFCKLKSGKEPTLLRKLKAGDYVGACNELPKWNNPKHLKGLTTRRNAEQQLCLRDL